MDKQSLREHAKQIRKKAGTSIISLAICNNIKQSEEYKRSKNIMMYYPFGSELNLLKLMDDTSKSWFLPKVSGDELDVYIYQKGDPLNINQWQIKEPCLEERKTNKNSLDLVIIPGLCADKKGFRLGYGMGFYDRFVRNLPTNCIKMLPVVDELFMDEIPKDLWDEPIDIVVTEKGSFKINS